MPDSSVSGLVAIDRELSREVSKLKFAEPVAYVYNPLVYAREPHEMYLTKFASTKKEALFLGMNPGPFGMAQTGVPFGEISYVRDFLGISGKVKKPKSEHPKRPILGFDCNRSEVSGSRLWGFIQERFTTAEAFFERFFVTNYCPLVFMEEGGKNYIPEKLPKDVRERLFAACDRALQQRVRVLQPKKVIGVGKFAEKRAKRVLKDFDLEIGSVLHPSPASPKANQGWVKHAEEDLRALKIELPPKRSARG